MTTKEKKATVKLHTVRPGEVVVEYTGTGERPTFAIYSRPGPMTTYAFVFRTGGVYVIPAWTLMAGDDVELFVKQGTLVVREDLTEGEIPQTVDYANSRERALARDGVEPPLSEGELRHDFRNRYGSHSLGDSIFECVRAGVDESRAAEILVPAYENAFATNTGRDMVWVEIAGEMIQAAHARAAGIE